MEEKYPEHIIIFTLLGTLILIYLLHLGKRNSLNICIFLYVAIYSGRKKISLNLVEFYHIPSTNKTSYQHEEKEL